jgi:hypothetical protein
VVGSVEGDDRHASLDLEQHGIVVHVSTSPCVAAMSGRCRQRLLVTLRHTTRA